MATVYRLSAGSSHDTQLKTFDYLLLSKMGQTTAPLNPKPDWFDYTYKISSDRSSA